MTIFKKIGTFLFLGLLLSAAPAFATDQAAENKGGMLRMTEEQEMLVKAYINLKAAEAYDKQCNQSKITGKVKDRGHSANFDRNRTLLATELSNEFGKTGTLSPPQVQEYLAKIEEISQGQMRDELKKKGCRTDDAEHSERVLDLFSRTQPDFLIKKLREHIQGKAAQ